jgi:hypothetical protein
MQDAKVCAGQFGGSRIAVFLEDAHSTKAGSFPTAERKSWNQKTWKENDSRSTHRRCAEPIMTPCEKNLPDFPTSPYSANTFGGRTK